MRANRNGTQRQTALVTGGSGGIGIEIAKVLARGGFDLVLVARKRDTLEAAAGQIEGKFDVRVQVFAADLRRTYAPQSIFDCLHNENIPIEVLVNNAGFGLGGEFADTKIQRELEMIQVNIAALTHLTKLFLPPMIKRKSGRLLNVASTAAFQPGPGMAVYYATKAYVLSFSEAVAEEVAGTGVTITALCPGPTDTNFAAAAEAEFSHRFKKAAMTAESVARIGHRAFREGRVLAIAGFRNRLLALSVRVAPRSVVRKVVKRLNLASYS